MGNTAIKKVILLFSAGLFFAAAATAGIDAPYSLELRGIYYKTAFSGFNDYYSGIFSYSFNINVSGSNMDEMGGIEAILGWQALPETVFYFRGAYSMGLNTDQLKDTFHNTIPVESTAKFAFIYAGLGAKRRVPFVWPGFEPYLALDAGMFMHIGSYWKVTADPSVYFVNPAYASQEADFTGSFWGGDVEAGFEWQVTDWAGIEVNGGYRLASCTITFPDKGLFADAHYSDPVDVGLSGFYMGIGLNLYFGAPAAVTETAAGSPWTEQIKKADSLYEGADYKNAILSYAQALRAGGPFSIYKKLAFAYFKLGDRKKAAYYGGIYLRYYPNDTAVQKWVDTLK
jgi:hypothetical protein